MRYNFIVFLSTTVTYLFKWALPQSTLLSFLQPTANQVTSLWFLQIFQTFDIIAKLRCSIYLALRRVQNGFFLFKWLRSWNFGWFRLKRLLLYAFFLIRLYLLCAIDLWLSVIHSLQIALALPHSRDTALCALNPWVRLAHEGWLLLPLLHGAANLVFRVMVQHQLPRMLTFYVFVVGEWVFPPVVAVKCLFPWLVQLHHLLFDGDEFLLRALGVHNGVLLEGWLVGGLASF